MQTSTECGLCTIFEENLPTTAILRQTILKLQEGGKQHSATDVLRPASLSVLLHMRISLCDKTELDIQRYLYTVLKPL